MEEVWEPEQQQQEVAKSEERLRKVEQKKGGLVRAAFESTSTAVVEGNVQAEEKPAKSRKENRLARKERRMKKKLEEYQALEGSEGAESFTKGALHFPQRCQKALFGKKYIEAQVKAQVFKKIEDLASDPATPPPLLPVRGTLPAPSEKAKPDNVTKSQPESGNRKADMETRVKKPQVDKKMKELSLDPATPPPLLPVRGTLPARSEKAKPDNVTNSQPESGNRKADMKTRVKKSKKMKELSLDSATPPQPLQPLPVHRTPSRKAESVKPAASTHKFMNRTEKRALKKGFTEPEPERPKYRGFWALPTIDLPPPPGSKPKKVAAVPPALKSLVGTKPTPESILRNSKSHPSWIVQKAALQKKFKNTPWQARKRISPGTVSLIKAINAEAPHVLKAQEVSAKFKISPEAARRILGSKRVMSDEEKERKAIKWLERGEMIKRAKIDSGEIWTKDKRRNVWEVQEKLKKIREMNEKFGIETGKKEGGGVQVERSLGRINWEGKFI
ncbi:hypothetical protein L211DRAFT_834068 [Terfezia boudieri ATCC MYA-4762]|uniref:Required for respiratory growth protein 9, mitochondrial n=1 Tax=Terfezia boudieri ATCC MYA-4762 TaxID=1051890 RepID=A0A3N4LYS5_9PEZI|nr:hypothetical protein L211DRAFT_834068 [Terfezia boudieri ATCC MYA-4762]